MPIFEYGCGDCGHTFEALVLKEDAPDACPACQGQAIERLLSLPTVQSDGTHALAMKAARRRDAAQGKDRMHEQRKYELSHDD